MDSLRLKGRRRGPRRLDERRVPYFVDRFHPSMLALIVVLLALTLVDGVLTLELIDLNSVEANPIMAHLLNRGDMVFLMGKYIMTAAGLPFLVVFQHHSLFGSRFRVGWLLPIFIGLYCILLFHQWSLFQIGRTDALREKWGGVVRAASGRGASSPGAAASVPRPKAAPSSLSGQS